MCLVQLTGMMKSTFLNPLRQMFLFTLQKKVSQGCAIHQLNGL